MDGSGFLTLVISNLISFGVVVIGSIFRTEVIDFGEMTSENFPGLTMSLNLPCSTEVFEIKFLILCFNSCRRGVGN